MKCSVCYGSDFITGLKYNAPQGGSIQIIDHILPHAMLMRNTISVPAAASVCKNCGHVVLCVDRESLKRLNDADDVKKASKGLKDFRSHTKFKEFLAATPLTKSCSVEDQTRGYAEWLRTHSND